MISFLTSLKSMHYICKYYDSCQTSFLYCIENQQFI